MKQRTAIHLFLSLAVAVMLIICGTAFQTRYSADPQVWVQAHLQTPLLWLVDFTAFYTLILMATLARAHRRIYRQAEELYVLREEHHNQLGAIIARASEIEEVNEQQAERIEQLEAQEQERQNSFEEEARHLVEQMFRSLQGQVEAHARQLDAVNLALQYHRAEISELRHHLRAVLSSPDLPPSVHLSQAEIAAIDDSLPALTAPPLLDDAGSRQNQEPSADEEDRSVAVVSVSDAGDSRRKPLADGVSAAATDVETQPQEPRAVTPKLTDSEAAVFDPTINARSTYVLDTAEFDAFSSASSGFPSLQENAAGN